MTGKARPEICKIMVEKFRGKIDGGTSDDWLRKRIDSKYKKTCQANNGKMRGLGKVAKLKKKINDFRTKASELESELLEVTHGTVDSIRNDL